MVNRFNRSECFASFKQTTGEGRRAFWYRHPFLFSVGVSVGLSSQQSSVLFFIIS